MSKLNVNAIFRKAFSRVLDQPPPGVIEGDGFNTSDVVNVDVCIVTNCAFIGGNASTTITELEAFRQSGLRCVIVHCPVKRSFWKRKWVAERYLPVIDAVIPSDHIESIRCKTLIIRGPRMAMTGNFEKLAKRIRAERTLYIVNNSAWSENGKPLFDWIGLNRRVVSIGLPNSSIYPISPLIRHEADNALIGSSGASFLASRDWPPGFRLEDYPFRPREVFSEPLVLGRHGRDHYGKWLEDPEELRAAYPDREGIVIKILGGAEVVRKRLGALPPNWVVLPFGETSVGRYLSEIDIFVNFPARSRDEAFGRTIVEAILCGVPVILPKAFEATFGDLAFYCEPHEVIEIVERLRADDDQRLRFLAACRDEAAERFGTGTLVERLSSSDRSSTYIPRLNAEAQAFRKWVMSS